MTGLGHTRDIDRIDSLQCNHRITQISQDQKFAAMPRRVIKTKLIFVVLGLSCLYGTVQLVNIKPFVGLRTSRARRTGRRMSINKGNGECEWTMGLPANQSEDLYTTMFVSYPGSGKRTAFQQAEGLAGLTTGDDFDLSEENVNTNFAFLKSSYPQHEGIWALGGADIDQTIFLLRNPRWAIPTYHHILYEINYAKTWDEAYDYLDYVYTTRSPMKNWNLWRTLRAPSEIHWWGWTVDFWMEGGLLRNIWTHELCTPEHFAKLLRPTKYTYEFLMQDHAEDPTTERTTDYNCLQHMNDQCSPTEVIIFEKLMDPLTGPAEQNKIAKALEGKPGINVIEEEARACVWRELIVNRRGLPNLIDRDGHGPARQKFWFTYEQMEMLIQQLERVRDKYSVGQWTDDPRAQALVEGCNTYIEENKAELATMEIPAIRRDPWHEALNVDFNQPRWQGVYVGLSGDNAVQA